MSPFRIKVIKMSSGAVQFEAAEKRPCLVVCGGWCSHVGRHGKPHKVGAGILFWRGNALTEAIGKMDGSFQESQKCKSKSSRHCSGGERLTSRNAQH